MSDANKANTVEVPREVANRILMALDQGNAFNCAADLRACIKPRRWEFERFVQPEFLDRNDLAFWIKPATNALKDAYIPVRVIVEEIV